MFAKSVSSRFSSARSLRSPLAAVGLACLGFAAGCSASADIPEVVVTRSDVEFAAVPVIPGFTDMSHELSTSFDHPSDFELPEGLNPELRPLSASVSGAGDMQDLSFLEGLEVKLGSRAPGAPEPYILAYYERPTNGQAGRVVQLQTNRKADVLSYWDTKEAYYDVRIWGILPPEDWAIDVTFAFSGSISVSTN
jgi:hypothetical protein